MLPPPVACGAPPAFEAWRDGQPEAVCHVVDSPARITALVLPTGSGKSLVAATLATLTGWRTCILTSTKGLQDQIHTTFHTTGLKDLRGQRAYPCRMLLTEGQHFREGIGKGCDVGPCKLGLTCQWRERGCSYFDAVADATRAPLVVTNYQAWMSHHEFRQGLGPFDCLVCDEAHAAPEEVSNFLACTITHDQLDAAGLDIPADATITGWVAWARAHRKVVTTWAEHAVRDAAIGGVHTRAQSARALATSVERLAVADPEDWLVLLHGSYQFHPLDPGRYVEATLLHGIPRIVLMSATMTPKTVAALGLDPALVDFHATPSTFPVERRPVTHITTCRIDHRLDDAGTRVWLARVDQILAGRPDRKGIIHTGSYARAKLIYEHSAHRARLLFHDRDTTRQTVELFRRSRPGTVLVSPSLTTGFDFAGKACEFQIILKVPWPDSREPVMQARTAKDKAYPAYLAMQDLVQAVGRGMRSAEDQCETLILDDHCKWFVSSYRHYAPRWFLDAYRSTLTIPVPPPPL